MLYKTEYLLKGLNKDSPIACCAISAGNYQAKIAAQVSRSFLSGTGRIRTPVVRHTTLHFQRSQLTSLAQRLGWRDLFTHNSSTIYHATPFPSTIYLATTARHQRTLNHFPKDLEISAPTSPTTSKRVDISIIRSIDTPSYLWRATAQTTFVHVRRKHEWLFWPQ